MTSLLYLNGILRLPDLLKDELHKDGCIIIIKLFKQKRLDVVACVTKYS